MGMNASNKIATFFKYFVLILVGIIMIYPLLWMISATFKDNSEIFAGIGLWIKNPTLDGYRNALNNFGGSINILQAIRLGGGSASIINGSDLDHLLRLIRSCYHVAEDAPVTMRTCPADINGANMPFYNRSHFTRYDLELYSLEPLDFCTLDTLNYSEQMPYITHGFLRADRRDSMGFVLLYGKKTVSRWGFRHSVLEVTRRPVCHVLLQRCAGADMLDDAAAQAQLDEAAQLLTEAGFVQYLPRRWAKPGCEDKFWQGAANGMDVLAFGLSAYTRLDGMITTNTSDLNTYLAHSADYEQITVSTVPVQTAE